MHASILLSILLLLTSVAGAEFDHCDAAPLPEPDEEYLTHIQELKRHLGIPPDYGKVTGLPLQPLAPELAPASEDPHRGFLMMTPDAARAWVRMQNAARWEGIELIPVSTYRGPRQQAIIMENRLSEEPLEAILMRMTAPGYSEHHTGDAIDITSAGLHRLDVEFAETPAYEWLQENAADFCFELSYPEDNGHGLQFEPWHWRFVRGAAPQQDMGPKTIPGLPVLPQENTDQDIQTIRE